MLQLQWRLSAVKLFLRHVQIVNKDDGRFVEITVVIDPSRVPLEERKRALKLVGWNEAARLTDAKIVWDVKTLADSPQQASDAPQPHQLVNYIPAMLHCCRKGVFALLLGRLRALLPPANGSALSLQMIRLRNAGLLCVLWYSERSLSIAS